MLPGLFFTFWRNAQLLTLIPVIGMLAYFVNAFTRANMLTPAYVLALFIVSVLAAFWALATLLAYHQTKWNAHFCALVDLLFVGALIAGVYYLRGITSWDCVSNPQTLGPAPGIDLRFAQVSGGVTLSNFNKTCSMLKASFAFGIMNIFFFFITFVRAPLCLPSNANAAESSSCCGSRASTSTTTTRAATAATRARTARAARAARTTAASAGTGRTSEPSGGLGTMWSRL
jgi:hypothetical protein